MAPAPPNNEFCRFSQRVYAAREVSGECLVLQDTGGVNINLLLFCAWLGWIGGISLNDDDIDACHQQIDGWDRGCVRPLRDVRRYLREMSFAEGFRGRIKELELEAEWNEQLLLFEFAQQALLPSRTAGIQEKALRSNLSRLLRRHQIHFDEARSRLAQTVMSFSDALPPR